MPTSQADRYNKAVQIFEGLEDAMEPILQKALNEGALLDYAVVEKLNELLGEAKQAAKRCVDLAITLNASTFVRQLESGEASPTGFDEIESDFEEFEELAEKARECVEKGNRLINTASKHGGANRGR